ncbi:hypothetical protein PRIPAC_84712 [Pristionchus pacificus]|uniref:Tyrosine phosphatase n=1 Tax=Pristionchus pacificus TaxID=54126 RepID=A0A2A6D1F6_PRIPA|nr:hypothetical protein PRIPAC_84712 [Pristionchus pacificus]|eukprot:PDM84176.1 tyrosine phosphatase [Pristionchus pacificus]
MTKPRKRSTVEGDGKTKTAIGARPVNSKKKTKRATVERSAEGKKNAEVFMKKYSDLGIEGICAEYKKDIEPYKSPTFGEKAFKANAGKNRHKEPTTCLDDSRVSVDEGKLYINASWMYDQQRIERQYILTQTPLDNTIEDFWKMFFEHKVICTVVLCDKTSDGQDVMADFWPTNDGLFKNYGNIAVCNKKVRACIVQMTKWESTYTQSTGRNLLKAIRVISRLENLAAQSGNVGPIVVMDELSGISRASILAVVDVMSALIYKGDKVTTLSDLVKWARRCRNGAIKNEDDYVAVIKTIFEYLYRTNQDKFKDQFEKLCGKSQDPN